MSETAEKAKSMFDGATAPVKLLQDNPEIGKGDIVWSIIYGFVAGWLTRAYTLRDAVELNAFGFRTA